MAKAQSAARQAVNTAKRNVKQDAPKAEPKASAPKEQTPEQVKAQAKTEAEGLVGSVVKVTGGKKHKGDSGIVAWGGVNRYGKKLTRVEITKGEDLVFFDADHLTVTGKADPKDVKRLKEMVQSERDETLYVAAFVGHETDAAVRLDYPGWFKKLWFSKEMIVDTGATLNDAKNTPIFEIPAWKVKKECGHDSYEALRGKQAELAKLVG